MVKKKWKIKHSYSYFQPTLPEAIASKVAYNQVPTAHSPIFQKFMKWQRMYFIIKPAAQSHILQQN